MPLPLCVEARALVDQAFRLNRCLLAAYGKKERCAELMSELVVRNSYCLLFWRPVCKRDFPNQEAVLAQAWALQKHGQSEQATLWYGASPPSVSTQLQPGGLHLQTPSSRLHPMPSSRQCFLPACLPACTPSTVVCLVGVGAHVHRRRELRGRHRHAAEGS